MSTAGTDVLCDIFATAPPMVAHTCVMPCVRYTDVVTASSYWMPLTCVQQSIWSDTAVLVGSQRPLMSGTAPPQMAHPRGAV